MPPTDETPPSSVLRLGPVAWVPGLRTSANDPWAHRKGEPRPLALLWSLYLMVSALATLLRVRSLTLPTTAQFAFGCRSMVLMVLLGVAVLWPMLRLSQQSPSRPNRSLAADLIVLLTPVQAVVWPMTLLTHWPMEVAAGLMGAVVSWATMSAGVLAWAYVEAGPGRRWAWMAACLALGALVPVLCWAIPAPIAQELEPTLALASPHTVAWGLTAAPNGLAPVMQPMEWVWTLAPGMAGVVLWIGASRFAGRRGGGYS